MKVNVLGMLISYKCSSVGPYACFPLALNMTNVSSCQRWYLKAGPLNVFFLFCTCFKSSSSTQLAGILLWVYQTFLSAVTLFICKENGNFWNVMLYTYTTQNIFSSSWYSDQSVIQSLSDTYSGMILNAVRFSGVKALSINETNIDFGFN